MPSSDSLFSILKKGYDSLFKRKLINSREMCCKINTLIEEYLSTHAITSIPFVNLCADLPAANLHTGEIWGVLQDTGVSWIPSWLGGTYCPHGLWRSNGVTWDYLGVFSFQATQAEVDAGILTDRFVSPNTFENAAKWDTKNDAIQWKDEGVNLGTPGTVTSIDFSGPDVLATRIGDAVTVTIAAPPSGYNVNNINTSPYTETAVLGEVLDIVDASGGIIIFNLPNAVGNAAKITINKSDSSLNTVDVTPAFGQTINGYLIVQLAFQNSSMELMSDGFNWIIT